MSVTQGTWNTAEQIRDHKLACSVINFHETPDAVFDDERLAELKDFTSARSVAKRDDWLLARELIDAPGAEYPGSKAAQVKGSLTGLLVARYGTDNPAFDERDWQLLEEWFAKGMPAGQKVSR